MQRLSTTILYSKKIETRIQNTKNTIKRHDLRSVHTAHTYDNCHTFNWTETQLLGRAHAREFKEAWYSTGSNTINRHIEIPTIYLQLKTLHRSSTNIDVNMTNTNNVDVPIARLSTSTTQNSNHSNKRHPETSTHPHMRRVSWGQSARTTTRDASFEILRMNTH